MVYFRSKPGSKEAQYPSSMVSFWFVLLVFTRYTVDAFLFVGYRFMWTSWVKVNHEFKCSIHSKFLLANWVCKLLQNHKIKHSNRYIFFFNPRKYKWVYSMLLFSLSQTYKLKRGQKRNWSCSTEAERG